MLQHGRVAAAFMLLEPCRSKGVGCVCLFKSLNTRLIPYFDISYLPGKQMQEQEASVGPVGASNKARQPTKTKICVVAPNPDLAEWVAWSCMRWHACRRIAVQVLEKKYQCSARAAWRTFADDRERPAWSPAGPRESQIARVTKCYERQGSSA